MHPRAMAVTLAVLALSTMYAQTPPATDTPLARGRIAFALADRELIPESLAYDPADASFYVGSLYKRKIIRVAADGRVTDFVRPAADGIWSVLGIKIDAARRELWANACNLQERNPPMTPDDPATRGHGGVFRYDLRTGTLVAKYLVGWAMAPRCFNDLVILPDGTVYLTSGPDGLYRVASGSARVELFAEHHAFLNGIAASDDGRLLFLADHRGAQVMDIATRTSRPIAVPSGETLAGIDGLYVRGHTLVAVQNGFRSRPERVVQAELSSSFDAVTCFAVLDRNRPEYDIPTTGVLVGDELFYIAASQLRRFDDQKRIFPWEKLRESVILRTPLEVPCGQSGR